MFHFNFYFTVANLSYQLCVHDLCFASIQLVSPSHPFQIYLQPEESKMKFIIISYFQTRPPEKNYGILDL